MSAHKEESHTHTLPTFGLDIPIFTKLYDFYKELYQALKTFPKRDRYSLGQKIENIALDVFELLFKINIVDKPRKLELLENINAKLDFEKVLLRLARDNKCLDNKRYLHLESSLQELGKMTGGWIRYLKNP